MKLTDIANNTNINQTVVLEDLGNLSQLNLGSMINLLKQEAGSRRGRRGDDTWAGPVGNKFVGQWIGSTSEIVDLGTIKDGIKSIRKAYRQNETARAFALYIGGQAVLFAVIDDYAIAGSSRTGKMAYDFSKFQSILDQLDTEAWYAKPEYQRWGTKQKTVAGTYYQQEPSDWEKRQNSAAKPKHFQGTAVSTAKLASTIELVMDIAKRAGQTVTGKLVLADKTSQQKRNKRYFNKQEITDGYKDLRSRLAIYKNSKRPTVNTIEEFVRVSIKNQGKVVRFAGTTYLLSHDGYDKIDPGKLLAGKPFTVSYRSKDPGVYDSLDITYYFSRETNMLLPVFANWYDRTDPANSRTRQEAVLDAKGYLQMKFQVSSLDDKPNVLKALLGMVKSQRYKESLSLIAGLEKYGKDWPELETIKKSTEIELNKQSK